MYLQRDECYFLIYKIIEQAVHDFIQEDRNKDKENYYTACEFLFNDDYKIMYGDFEQSLEQLLNLVNLNVNWFRKKIIKLKEKKLVSIEEKRQSLLKIFLQKISSKI